MSPETQELVTAMAAAYFAGVFVALLAVLTKGRG